MRAHSYSWMNASKSDINRTIDVLYTIDSMLSNSKQLKIPSLITNYRVNASFYKIEEMLLVT
jgi:hypothetical protein